MTNARRVGGRGRRRNLVRQKPEYRPLPLPRDAFGTAGAHSKVLSIRWIRSCALKDSLCLRMSWLPRAVNTVIVLDNATALRVNDSSEASQICACIAACTYRVRRT
jgi:hypothetical protein